VIFFRVGWSQITILSISASQVARNTGLNHSAQHAIAF
jgi:hypothetical protein